MWLSRVRLTQRIVRRSLHLLIREVLAVKGDHGLLSGRMLTQAAHSRPSTPTSAWPRTQQQWIFVLEATKAACRLLFKAKVDSRALSAHPPQRPKATGTRT